jgi:hypothetical protein
MTLGRAGSFPRDAVSLRDGPAAVAVTERFAAGPTGVQIARRVDEALDAIDQFG